jgi:hypothetical protein
MAKKALKLAEITETSRRQTELARQRIATSKLVDRLQSCALGDIEMTNSQLRAAEVLLQRVLPIMTESRHTVENQQSFSISDQTAQAISALIAKAKEPKQIEGITIDHEPAPYMAFQSAIEDKEPVPLEASHVE